MLSAAVVTGALRVKIFPTEISHVTSCLQNPSKCQKGCTLQKVKEFAPAKANFFPFNKSRLH